MLLRAVQFAGCETKGHRHVIPAKRKTLGISKFVFYFFAFISVIVIASIINSLLHRRQRSAFMTFRIYLVLVAIYGVVLLATMLALPIRTLPMNEPQFSGDWSITPTSLRRVPHDLDETYEIDFRLANRSNAELSGPKGLIVYLLTEDGTRYNPIAAPSEPAFDVTVKPRKAITTTRTFIMPTNLNRVELVMARQGFRLGWFLIGRSEFDGRTIIMVQ